MGEMIVLPAVKHSMAAQFKTDLIRLDPFVPEHMRQAFYPSFLAEVNNLKPNVDYRSVMVAAMNCAVVGLAPGAARGHCYLVPFWDKDKEVACAQLVMGYKGWMELGYRSNHLGIIHTPQVVLEGEEFELWSDENGHHFRHRRPPTRRDKGSRRNVVGAYVAYGTTSGHNSYTYVDRGELDEVDSQKNVWKSDYIAMCMKTAIHRAAKTWRTTSELSAAHRSDETMEYANDEVAAAADAILTTAKEQNQGARVKAMFEAEMQAITPKREKWVDFCRWVLGDPTVDRPHLDDPYFCQRVMDELEQRKAPPEDLARQSGVMSE
jgi:phage RecT family recombinase